MRRSRTAVPPFVLTPGYPVAPLTRVGTRQLPTYSRHAASIIIFPLGNKNVALIYRDRRLPTLLQIVATTELRRARHRV